MATKMHDVKYKEKVYKLKPIDLNNNVLGFRFIDNPDFPVSIRDGDRVAVYLASGEFVFTEAIIWVGGFTLSITRFF